MKRLVFTLILFLATPAFAVATGPTSSGVQQSGNVVAGHGVLWAGKDQISDSGSAPGSVSFSSLTSGTNTIMTGVVGTGASLSTSGSGTIIATGMPTSGLTGILQAAQFPALTGDITTSSGSLATSLKATGTAGTYGVTTTDAQGRVTSGLTISPVTNGGTGAGTLTGLIKGNGTAAMTAAVAGVDYLAPFGSQTANNFYASPNGSSGIPSFRAIVVADIPTLNQNTTGQAGTVATINSLIAQGANITITGSGTSVSPYSIAAAASATPSFSALTSGTNSGATMVIATGASLGASGSGTIAATSAPASGLTGATIASGVTASSLTSVGTLGNLTVTNPISGNITGNAATVTTNANLTGDVTSVGNATTLAASAVTSKALTGFSAGAGTVSATDSILTAFNKIVGNISALVTGVSSVSNSDSTITFSPTTGAVVGSINLAHANTWTQPITIASGAITTNISALNITQTWNNSGTTFDAPIFVNVTNTASNAASKLFDLQVGGVSQFNVSEIGNLIIGAGTGTVASISSPTGGMTFGINGHVTFGIGQISSSIQYFTGISTDYIGFAPSTDPGANPDTMWSRKGAANMALGAADAAAPVAQSFSVQNVVTGTSNTAGANFTQNMSQGTGTGTGGSYILRVAPAGTTGNSQNALATALTIDSTKLATFAGAISVASLATVGTLSVLSGTSTFNQIQIAAGNGYFWSGRSSIFSPADGILELLNNAGTGFTRLQLGGTTSSFPAIKVNGAAINLRLADDSADAAVTMGGITNSGANLGLINVTTTTFASTVTPVGSNNFNVFNFGTQTGNVTIAAPSGTPVDGNQLTVRFVIDATGGYTTTFNTIYAFGTDITTALIPTVASSKFELKFIYNATDSKWRAVAIARGF